MSVYPSDINFWPKVIVYDTDFRKHLLEMADAITSLELWTWLKEYEPESEKGFMFSRNDNLNKIINETQNSGHSGATFAYSMRGMEMIAKSGFEEFYNKFK